MRYSIRLLLAGYLCVMKQKQELGTVIFKWSPVQVFEFRVSWVLLCCCLLLRWMGGVDFFTFCLDVSSCLLVFVFLMK